MSGGKSLGLHSMAWCHLVEKFRIAMGSPQSCFIIGATGQVGRCLLDEIMQCGAFNKVISISRQSVSYTGPNLSLMHELIVPDFDDLEDVLLHTGILQDCLYGFCALGTTRAKAGSAVSFIIHIWIDYF